MPIFMFRFAEVRECESAKVRKCESAKVRKCESAKVRKCGARWRLGRRTRSSHRPLDTLPGRGPVPIRHDLPCKLLPRLRGVQPDGAAGELFAEPGALALGVR